MYINIIRDPIDRFLSNYFFRRFGDWRGEENHVVRTPGMKDDERYLVRGTLKIQCWSCKCTWIETEWKVKSLYCCDMNRLQFTSQFHMNASFTGCVYSHGLHSLYLEWKVSVKSVPLASWPSLVWRTVFLCEIQTAKSLTFNEDFVNSAYSFKSMQDSLSQHLF